MQLFAQYWEVLYLQGVNVALGQEVLGQVSDTEEALKDSLNVVILAAFVESADTMGVVKH